MKWIIVLLISVNAYAITHEQDDMIRECESSGCEIAWGEDSSSEPFICDCSLSANEYDVECQEEL